MVERPNLVNFAERQNLVNFAKDTHGENLQIKLKRL